MKKISFIVLVIAALVTAQSSAFAQFSVDWGTSNDTGNAGYTDLNTWFSNNGYSINAQTDYIGYGAADSDPFFFYSETPVTLQVVSRLAGNANLTSFGLYTGTGLGKSLTEVLGAGQNGPQNGNPNGVFGVYMNTPDSYLGSNHVNFFTDRTENSGSNPQALIYELAQNEWLIAWEDLNYGTPGSGGTDRDFNDAYLKVTSTVTPEPISMALFGLGAGALGLSRVRRKKA